MADLASGAAWRRRQHGCLRRWNLRGEAEEGATTPIVVVTRAADGGCGAGYGDPPFALQGGHRERRPTATVDWHQHQGGTCRVL